MGVPPLVLLKEASRGAAKPKSGGASRGVTEETGSFVCMLSREPQGKISVVSVAGEVVWASRWRHMRIEPFWYKWRTAGLWETFALTIPG